MPCELCESAGGEPLWRDVLCRVVLVNDAEHPGFCRVIWNAHVKEMTDLGETERQHVLRVALAVETALRKLLSPDKINLASLGNMTPHLHWHVIPRFHDDPHYPNPVWGRKLRAGPRVLPRGFRDTMQAALIRALGSSIN
ncbi:MAG TPA: HIT family protein [Burkholderiales bacterium]|nr:HIT family protein [Burkholderiales bacterium]